jgi:hypothetical protein
MLGKIAIIMQRQQMERRFGSVQNAVMDLQVIGETNV